MNKYIFTVFLFLLSTFLFAQKQINIDKAQAKINQRGEVYIKFKIADPSALLDLSRNISIDNVINNQVIANVNQKEFQYFLNYDIDFEVYELDRSAKTTVSNTVAGMASWDKYPVYEVLDSMMYQFEADYPNLCKIENIGTSTNGRDILVAKISDNINTDENEPEYLYTGTMHGDEITGLVVLLRLIDYLLTNYGSDPQVTNLVDNIEIWINPAANPDGTYYGGNNNVSNAIRRNGQNIDLNRNYPDQVNGDHPDGNSWGTETVHFMNFAANHDFVMAANTHGGAEVVNYPWDSWDSATNMHPDDSWWQYVSLIYANNAQNDGATVGLNSYLTGVSSNGITEGGDWYVVDGSRQDYMNYFHNCRETTLEISNTKLLNAADLPDYWVANKQALLDYLEQVLYGIRGVITDACTGQPIVARVEILGHDQDSSHIFSSLPVGNYHRPIDVGSWDLTYSAPGYQSQTITINVVSNTSIVTQDVQLTPNPPLADFSASETTSCSGTIDFTCITQGVDTWSWDFGDGDTSNLENPTHTYISNGTYTVTMTVSNCGGSNSDQIIKTNYITINAPSAPTGSGASACGSSSVDLQTSGSGTIFWYDQQSGGTYLDTGNTFTTPVIANTTDYYAENVTVNQTSYYVGSTDSQVNGNYHNGSWYNTFDVLTPIILRSVEVNTQSAGNLTVELVDQGGTTIQSVTAAAPAGVSRVDLDFIIPVGTNYGLRLNSGLDLYRNNSGISYPYEIANVVSITSSTAGGSYYYYFYDWEVQTSDTCRSSRTSVTATIEQQANVDIVITSSDDTICSGDTILFEANTSNSGSSPSFNWSINGSTVQTGNDSTFLSNSITDGDVVTSVLTSSLACNNGPATSNSITIFVSSNLTPAVTINANSTSFCQGDTAIFNAGPDNGGVSPYYEWYLNGSLVQSGSNSTYTSELLSDNDLIECLMISSSSCVQNDSAYSNSIIVQVDNFPVADFAYSDSSGVVEFTNNSNYATSYIWYFGDGNSTNMPDPTHTYTASGTYDVTLIATNNCGTDTFTVSVTVVISNINDNNAYSEIELYPNPVQDVINLTNLGNLLNNDAEIIDVLGRNISIIKIENNSINVKHLTNGVYYIRFKSDKKVIIKKFVKE